MTSLVPLAAVLFASGLLLVGLAVLKPRPPLQSVVGRTDPTVPRRAVDASRGSDRWGAATRCGTRASAELARAGVRLRPPRRSDLAVFGLTAETFVGIKVIAAAAGGVLAAVPAALVVVAGSAPSIVVVGLPFLVGALAFVLPDVLLPTAAASRRERFEDAFHSYLVLLGALVAGGIGTEEALKEASLPGRGWHYDRIRSVLHLSTGIRRTDPWSILKRLGEDLDIPAVWRLAARIELQTHQGVALHNALLQQSAVLAAHRRKRAVAADSRSTVLMNLPQAGMVVAFLAFLFLAAMRTMQQAF